MENRILLKAGIKRHKGSLFGITVLLFLVSLSMVTVLTVFSNGSSYMREEIRRSGFGQLTAWVSNVPDMQALTESVRSLKEVGEVKLTPLIYSEYKANEAESDSEGQLIPWKNTKERYRFFREDLSGYQPAPKEITAGQVYISPSMVSIMDLEIGDNIEFPLTRGGENLTLTVAGYYEDPYMGSSMIGMKGFLISQADYENVYQKIRNAGRKGLARAGAMMHISMEAQSGLTVSGMNQLLNEKTSLSLYTEFVHSAHAIEGFMIILQNAFCGILAAFALVLLGVAMVVLGHSITGLIEQDYKNLGILKTIGFTGERLICIQIIQYLSAVLAGLLLGMLAAVPLTDVISRGMVTTTGVLIPHDLPALPCFILFVVILILLSGFTVWKSRSILCVAPMGAVRGDHQRFRWKYKKTWSIKAKGLPFYLAVRQLLSGKKRYLSACLAAVLLVFFASLAGSINAWLGPQGKGMMDAFNPADLDIGVQAMGNLKPEEMERTVSSYSDITDSYLLAMPSVSAEGKNYTANVITEPERFHISRGQTCKKKDEIVLTQVAALDLGVSVGDQVTVRGNAGSSKYTVSGIYHCANDMGANMGMSREGYEKIGRDDPQIWCHHYFLSDSSQKAAITKALTSAYGGDVHVHENTWPGLYGIISAMRTLLVFMYGMTAVFVLVVTVLAGSKIFLAEQKDLGIYKSIGCSSSMLRLTFSLRFGLAAFFGSVLGTTLSVLLTDPLVSRVMRLAGISNFASQPSMGSILLPGALVTLLFAGFSYLTSGKIKKTDMTVLIAE